MSTERTKRTPEEKKNLLDKVAELRKTKTIEEACKEVGLNVSTYMGWLGAKGKKVGKKGKRPYRRKKVESTTALVAVNPEQERTSGGFNGAEGKPNVSQVAQLLAEMNAASLRTLMQGRM